MQRVLMGFAMVIAMMGCAVEAPEVATSEAAINLDDCQEQMDAVVAECNERFEDVEPGTCIGVEVCCDLSWGPFVTPGSVSSCLEATAVMRAVIAECAGMHCAANFDMDFEETDHALTLEEIEEWVIEQIIGIAADAVVQGIMNAIAAALDYIDGEDEEDDAGDGAGSNDDMEDPEEEDNTGGGAGSNMGP